MLRFGSAIAALVFTAVVTSGGCSDSGGSEQSGKGGHGPNGGSAGSEAGGGSGGSAGSAGGKGGRGGSAGKGGSSAGDAGEGSGAAGAGGDGDTGGAGGEGGAGGCSPTNDACPDHQYCSGDGACVPGCKNDDACASGNCTAAHECDGCVTDDECLPGRICGDGHCQDPCTGPSDCDTNLDCCDGRCAQTDYDIRNCLGCDMSCTAGEFCSTDGCADATFANVCKIRSVVVIIDDQPGDLAPSQALGAALGATCMPNPPVTEIDEADASMINPMTGAPLVGGDALAVAGGYFGQDVIAFLDSDRSAPVSPVSVNGTFELRRRDTGGVIVSFPFSAPSASHDYIVIEVARDRRTGVLAIVAYGFNAAGTAAAVWYFSNNILTDLAANTGSWFVFEWTDDGDSMPDAGDTFRLIDSD